MKQREIKFRAWDTRLKMWCYGLKDDGFTLFGEVLMIDGFFSHFFENPAKDEHGNEMGSLDRLNDIEVMQFTGLKDKNGKEIYEGDIVKFENQTFEIAWDTQYARFRRYNGHIKFDSFHGMDCYEVIGNIYEPSPQTVK